jgi:hypothetical protein
MVSQLHDDRRVEFTEVGAVADALVSMGGWFT